MEILEFSDVLSSVMIEEIKRAIFVVRLLLVSLLMDILVYICMLIKNN